MRQGSPLASGAQQVEHRIHDAAQLKHLRVAGLLAGCNERREDGPLFIAQVGRVRVSIHPPEMVTDARQNDAFRTDRRAIKLLNSL